MLCSRVLDNWRIPRSILPIGWCYHSSGWPNALDFEPDACYDGCVSCHGVYAVPEICDKLKTVNGDGFVSGPDTLNKTQIAEQLK